MNVFSSKVVKFTWKMQNVLNRKKNHILDFSNSNFSNYAQFMVIFVLKTANFQWICAVNRKKEIGKIWKLIFHPFQHIPHFMKMGAKLMVGGVCVSLVGTEPNLFFRYAKWQLKVDERTQNWLRTNETGEVLIDKQTFNYLVIKNYKSIIAF